LVSADKKSVHEKLYRERQSQFVKDRRITLIGMKQS